LEQRVGVPKRVLASSAYVFLFLAGSTLAAPLPSWAQGGASPSPSETAPAPTEAAQREAMTTAIQDLQQQVRQLRDAVAEIRSEAAEYRQETTVLRQELKAAQLQSSTRALSNDASETVGSKPGALEAKEPSDSAVAKDRSQPQEMLQRVSSLEDDIALLTGKIDDQYQTKVESASKYRVRLSGIVLLNLFSNQGATDNQDFPSFALSGSRGSNGNFGATLRQSQIGLDVFGPTWVGAKVSGMVQGDFSGGFPYTWNGVNSGYFRLRTASARMDWENTSLVAGQDDLFFSPLSPTSFASLAIPALTYSGNLWGWIPQVRLEHRFAISDTQSVRLQAGILDNLTGEYPSPVFWSRIPGPGESSGQPSYALRTSWSGDVLGRHLTLGAAGYYSRQNWGFARHIDGWAGMTDWNIPLLSRVEWSGEFYRGRGVGGIGGGLGQSVYFDSDPTNPSSQVFGLDSVGGWSQLKLKATSKLEFNGAFGLDSPTAAEIRESFGNQPYLQQNRSWLGNFIYRPRSDLLFSAEYRRLRTTPQHGADTAGQINLMMGVLF
jgi:hypothetical protein